MTTISLAWISLDFNLEIEEDLVKWTSIIKQNTWLTSFYHDNNSVQDYCFIDISGTKKAIENEFGQGKKVITDRAMLDSLFKTLQDNDAQFSYIICDVYFEVDSDDDSAFEATLRRIPNAIFPYQFDGDSVRLPVIPNIPVGYSGYYSSSGIGLKDSFMKYTLIEKDTMVSIPLRVLSNLRNQTIRRSMGFVWLDGIPQLNTIIPDMKIHPRKLYADNGFSRIISLEDILIMRNESDMIRTLVKDKIIVIGDFEGDLHETIYGKMPGPLVLVNILEYIKDRNLFQDLLAILFITATYALLSYAILFYVQRPGSFYEKVREISYPLIGSVGSRLIGFSFALYIVAVFSYFIFGVQFDILPLATYLSIVAALKRHATRSK